MAKKRPKPDGEPPDGPRPRRRTPRPKPPGSAYDAMMKKMFGELEPTITPRLRAQSLVQIAAASDDRESLVSLARQALLIWPDCVDAYALLAEQARSPKQTIALYEQAVAAGERDLGPEFFRDEVGHFWTFTPARPYMRARYGLAQALWVVGRRTETVSHYQELLRLNRGDNQGVRYSLAAALLELGRDDDLAALFEQYPEDASACWIYSTALLAFRLMGDAPETRRLRASALKANKYVPDYLTGNNPLPPRLPELISRGDRSEAIDYAVGFLNAWRATPGALTWLKKANVREPKAGAKPKKSRSPAARGPTAASKKRVLRLPQPEAALWQADARRMPIWITQGEPYRPWVIVVASRTLDLILAQRVLERPPSPALLWDSLVQAMEAPGACEPHRPAVLELSPSLPHKGLDGHLEDIAVQLSVTEPLDMMDDVFAKLAEHVNGRPITPGLLEMPAITPNQVASYFRAAATFYRDAPWQRVGGAETIKIECDRFESGPWYGVVIGQMGMTLGLALYEDLEALVRMRDGDASDEQNARDTVALSITYGDQTELPIADLDAAERHGWEVASPEAYPAAIRKERGMMIRPPLSWELLLLEACMLALPRFLAEHDRDEKEPAEIDVVAYSGPIRLRLSWTNV